MDIGDASSTLFPWQHARACADEKHAGQAGLVVQRGLRRMYGCGCD